jgi:type II secretory pathway pseudopilin PulG
MTGDNLKNQEGYTLFELISAVGIFIMILLMVSGISQSVINGQKAAIASQNTQDNMRFAFEMMSKELRSARGSDTACLGGSPNRIFNMSGNDLYFRNKDGECVYYFLQNDALWIDRDGESGRVTPDEVVVTGLEFDITDNPIAGPIDLQPRITLKIDTEIYDRRGVSTQPFTMQTTISSRFYE